MQTNLPKGRVPRIQAANKIGAQNMNTAANQALTKIRNTVNSNIVNKVVQGVNNAGSNPSAAQQFGAKLQAMSGWMH